jgi:2-dehydropantoate 2-reductase
LALRSVDPDGSIAAAIVARRVIGCVVHASASVTEPGLVEHHKGHGLIVGEPGGAPQERTQRVAALLSGAGFEVMLSERIHYDIWYKLWGNLTTNPVSAITGATADRIIDDPLVKAFCIAAMTEAARIGERIGCKVDQTPEERHELTRKLGAFKTSMLQDAEAGKPLEIDAIVGAVRELGERVGVPTPNIDALFGLTRLFARVKGLYPA